MKISINQKVKSIMAQKNITITFLSEQLDIKPQSLSRMLNSNDLKVSTLQEIATALDLPIAYFFEDDESVKDKVSKIEKALQKQGFSI